VPKKSPAPPSPAAPPAPKPASFGEQSSLLPDREWGEEPEEDMEDEEPRRTFRPRPTVPESEEEEVYEEEETETYDRDDVIEGDYDEDEY
jgi:hypothetical protein